MWFLMSSLETLMVGTTSPSERNNTSAPSGWLSHKAVPCTCASCFHFTQHCLYIYMKIISYSALPLGASVKDNPVGIIRLRKQPCARIWQLLRISDAGSRWTDKTR